MHALVRDNVTAIRSLLAAAQQRQARRVVMTSTPRRLQSRRGPANEQTALRSAQDRNPYLRTKRMADDLLQEAARQGLATVSMHPSHMLGPHDKAGWIRMFDDAAAGKLKAAPGGRASFSLVAQVALAHIAAAEHPSPASRHVLGGPAATYLEVFGRIAHLVGAKPVTSTIPAPALRAIGQLSDLWSGVTAGRPAMTPGLAQILTGDMLGDATLAEMQLGYRLPDLASILDATFAAWAGARLSSAPESPCCPAP